MNFLDILNSASNGEGSELANKIAMKSELRRIQRRSEDLIAQFEESISMEANMISRGELYGTKISKEQQQELLAKLKESSVDLPSKMRESVEEIFGKISDEKKEDKKEDEKKEEEKPADNGKEDDNRGRDTELSVAEIQKRFENGNGAEANIKPMVINPLTKFDDEYFGY